MPRKSSIDREVVRDALEKCGSANAAAKLLKVHPNSVLQISRELQGVCVRCCADPLPNRTMCRVCLDDMARRAKERGDARKARGVCSQCAKPVLSNGRRYCEDHQEEKRQVSYKQRQRRKDEDPIAWKETVSGWNRKSLYGEAGQQAWKKTNGDCQVCGKPREYRKSHIHHIDGNRANNARENLICVCKPCHILLHAIQWHPNRPAFFPWFRATYPEIDLPVV